MPKNIKPKHIKRMFPYEFYKELTQEYKDHVLLNPAFLLNQNTEISEKEQKKVFDASRQEGFDKIKQSGDTDNPNYTHLFNILQVEPVQEVLILEVCCPKDRVEIYKATSEKDKTVRSQEPLCVLVAQLYDSENLPVFAENTSEKTIENIPEILWDDPNLLIATITINQEGTEIGLIKYPDRMNDVFFIDKDEA